MKENRSNPGGDSKHLSVRLLLLPFKGQITKIVEIQIKLNITVERVLVLEPIILKCDEMTLVEPMGINHCHARSQSQAIRP